MGAIIGPSGSGKPVNMRHHGGMAGALIIPATVGSTDGATEGAHEFKAYRQACIMSSQRLWAMRLWMTRKMICSSLRAFYHFVSIPIWIPLACAPPMPLSCLF